MLKVNGLVVVFTCEIIFHEYGHILPRSSKDYISNIMPLFTKASLGSRNCHRISGLELLLEYHLSPIHGKYVPSTSVSFVTSTEIPSTIECFALKYKVISMETSLSYPYKHCTYSIHLAWLRIYAIWSYASSSRASMGSLCIREPPMISLFPKSDCLWLQRKWLLVRWGGFLIMEKMWWLWKIWNKVAIMVEV